MGANAINAAIIHHNDTVCILYGGDTLCDDQFGRTRDLLTESLTNLGICRRIDRTGTVIQDQYLGLLQQGSGNTKSLTLSTGNIAASLLDIGIIAVRETLDKLVCTGKFTSLLALLVRRIFTSPAQVLIDGS